VVPGASDARHRRALEAEVTAHAPLLRVGPTATHPAEIVVLLPDGSARQIGHAGALRGLLFDAQRLERQRTWAERPAVEKRAGLQALSRAAHAADPALLRRHRVRFTAAPERGTVVVSGYRATPVDATTVPLSEEVSTPTELLRFLRFLRGDPDPDPVN